MSHSNNNSFSTNYNYYHHEKADDSSTVFDADTVMPMPDEVTSLPPLPMPPLTATATPTDYLYSSPHHSSQEETPANTISVLLRRINSTRHHPAEPSTTTATAAATRIEAILTNQSSSSSSKKRPVVTNSSVKRKQFQENSNSTTTKKSSTKRPRRSSRLKSQQPQDQSYVDKSDSEAEDENEPEDYDSGEAVINQSSSQTSATKLTKREANWKSKFEELRAFKQLHGNVNAPQRNKELGEWVSTQRREYRKFIENKHSCMTSRRIQMLESICFEWVSPNKRGSRNESSWNKHFNELSEFKKVHGHISVPRSNKELGNWVNHQRTEYKKFKKNGKGKITKERIQTLESIGFEWELSKWNKQFTELKAYKEKYGHTNVSVYNKHYKQLGKWVSKQRTEYKMFKKNGKSCMTLERIQMLESIGFEWELYSEWNKQFNDLVEYIELHGHKNVPQRCKDNKQLGRWVSTQRTEYKKFQAKKKSSMTDERIEMLNSIGFEWECRPGRAPRSYNY